MSGFKEFHYALLPFPLTRVTRATRDQHNAKLENRRSTPYVIWGYPHVNMCQIGVAQVGRNGHISDRLSIPTVHDLDISGQIDPSSVWSVWSAWSRSCCRAGAVCIYNLHHLGHVSWVRSVHTTVYRSCTTSHHKGTCIPDLYDLYDLYDLGHVAGREPYVYITCII